MDASACEQGMDAIVRGQRGHFDVMAKIRRAKKNATTTTRDACVSADDDPRVDLRRMSTLISSFFFLPPAKQVQTKQTKPVFCVPRSDKVPLQQRPLHELNQRVAPARAGGDQVQGLQLALAKLARLCL